MKYINTILLVLVAVVLSLFIWDRITSPKIAWVNSYQLIDGYEGMKEVQTLYSSKLSGLQEKADSLQKNLAADIGLYDQDSISVSRTEKEKLAYHIRSNRLALEKLNDEINSFTTGESQKLSETVIHQIDAYIEKYGKEHHYDIIFGTAETGSLVYGSKSYDITEEVLKELNNDYLGNE